MPSEVIQAEIRFTVVLRDEAGRPCDASYPTVTLMASEFGRSVEGLATLAVDKINGEGGK